jgi:acyl-coenzyme A synthetase/AMP-(fatty) acid ligase
MPASRRGSAQPRPWRAAPDDVQGWEAGPAVTLPERCIHQLVHERALSTPEAIALISDDRRLSFAELDAMSDSVAHRLTELGLVPEMIVAVALDRSIELVVALLGILKAGGAYLPIDPSWPAEHQRQLLEQLPASPLLISTPSIAGELADHYTLVELEPRPLPAPQPATDYGLHTPRQLAYVNFTSGSTGQPKGVLVEHRGILRLLDPAAPWALGADDRVLQLAPISFDAATLEIWAPLCAGATLVIGPPDLPSLAEIASLITRHRITTLWLTAGLFHALAAEYAPVLASVRTLLAGGDVLHVESVRAVLDKMSPGHRLINGYGPTEGTTFTTCHVMTNGDVPLDQTSVPIGRPIHGTTVRVLDTDGKRCRVGELGEIHIGGSGLARGYLNDPALDAVAFVADPLGSAARLYRSGDVGCWNPDGTLSFHGRNDAQVKVNGVRIEPAEVTGALEKHPSVAAAEVVLRNDDPANPYLAAYWIPGASTPEPPTGAQLSAFLRTVLPEAMIPSLFVAVDRFPLNANGKLDRAALPAPSSPKYGNADRTDLEIGVHQAWVHALGHDGFGPDDHFVLVGGTSLAAMRLVARLESALDRPLPGRFAFRYPTEREQALFLAREDASADVQRPSRCLVTLQPAGVSVPLYVLHSWVGGLDHMFPIARALGPDRPVIGVNPDDMDVNLGVAARADIYAEAIMRHHPGGPIHLVGFSAGGWWAFATAGALLRRGARLGLVAVIDSPPATQLPSLVQVKLRAQNIFATATNAPAGQRWSQHAGRMIARRLPRLAASQQQPARAPSHPLLSVLRRETLPPLPISIELFTPAHRRRERLSLWRRFARGTILCHNMFYEHSDYLQPHNAPAIAATLERSMRRIELRGR